MKSLDVVNCVQEIFGYEGLACSFSPQHRQISRKIFEHIIIFVFKLPTHLRRVRFLLSFLHFTLPQR